MENNDHRSGRKSTHSQILHHYIDEMHESMHLLDHSIHVRYTDGISVAIVY